MFRANQLGNFGLGATFDCADPVAREAFENTPAVEEDGKLMIIKSYSEANCIKEIIERDQGTNFQGLSLLKSVLTISCEGQSLHHLVGVRYADLPKRLENLCPNGFAIQFFERSKSYISFSHEGKDFVTDTDTSHGFTNEKLGPCLVQSQGGVFRMDGCVENHTVGKRVNNFPDVVSVTGVYRDVTWRVSPKPSWFSSGKVDLGINNWEGSLEFSDPAVAPKYILTEALSLSNVFKGRDTFEGQLTEAKD